MYVYMYRVIMTEYVPSKNVLTTVVIKSYSNNNSLYIYLSIYMYIYSKTQSVQCH